MSDPERLFHAHASSLYRYLVRLTADSDVAADCVQDTFMRLLDGKQASVERAWLFKVATNLAFEVRRTAERRQRLLRGADARIPIADDAPTPLELVEASERHERALRALAALNAKERSAVLMREEGFSHREIAEALGTTTGSVGTLIARALVKFADAAGMEEA